LYLNNVAMVAADTTRSEYYIKQLIKNDILPQHIILLLNNEVSLLPGQKERELRSSVTELLKQKKITYDIAPNSDINSQEVITLISNRLESVFIFSGFGGALLRNDILSIGKKFLHVHGGYLPNYKGSTTNYYSLINENTVGASSIFLTKDIDCGPILLRKKFPPPKDRTEIDHVYDSKVRSIVLIDTLKKYITSGAWEFDLESNKGGETFYIIHPVLKHIAILRKE